ncbi:MAG: class I SAM-dependent methyltransferase [Deltaproteobacteria bacterium]|nr:class I SAM-dependent methyltransferase [Deltaproteobacteria bacterium]
MNVRPLKKPGTQYKQFLCLACGLVFSEPMKGADPALYRDAESNVDYWTWNFEISWHHRQFLEEKNLVGKTLLDIGCGVGEFLVEVKKAGCDVYGVDFVAEKIVVAKKRFGLENVFCASVFDAADTFKGMGFDFVTFFEVLEHLEDPVGFIRQVRTLLNPGGCIALSVPNRGRTMARFDTEDGPPHHLTRWNINSVTRFLGLNGFKVIRYAEKRPDIEGFLKSRSMHKGVIPALASALKPVVESLPLCGRGLYVLAGIEK